MRKLEFTRPHDLALVADQIQAAVPSARPEPGEDGVPTVRYSSDGETLYIEGPDNLDEAAITAIVAAHDQAAVKASRDTEVTNEEQILGKLEDAIAKLEQAGAGWPDLTPAQKDAVTRLAVRAVAKLSRLQLRRLDAVE